MTTTLRYNTFSPNAALVVAQARGISAAHGIEIETTVTRNSTDQMKGLSHGTWDIASTAFDNVLAWSGREGAEIVAVAQASGKIFLPLYVRPEINDWNDLRGRPLAVDAVDTAYALVLRRILLAHGLDFKKGDYELVAVGATGPRLDSLKAGKTFAGILNPPWDKRAEENGMKRFADYSEVLPDYPGGVFAVTRAWAQSHQAELVAFLKALQEAARWAADPGNEKEAVSVIARHQNVSPEVALKDLGQIPTHEGLNLAGLKVVLDLRVQFDMTPPMGPDLERYYDLQYYEAAKDR